MGNKKLYFILTVAFLLFLFSFKSTVFAQIQQFGDKAIQQGWLIHYTGKNLEYEGIPCRLRNPTEQEKTDLIGNHCDGSAPDCKSGFNSFFEWPTCESRNMIVVEQNGNRIAIDKPIPTSTSAPVKLPTKMDYLFSNRVFTFVQIILISSFTSSLVSIIILFLFRKLLKE